MLNIQMKAKTMIKIYVITLKKTANLQNGKDKWLVNDVL